MADERDYDDPAIEEAWCNERRQVVAEYLRSQNLDHGRVGEWPAWHVPPVVSIWAIESASKPGAIGWWVIAGDLPTDYVSGADAGDPRAAVRAFAIRWREAADEMRDGREPAGLRIARTVDERRSLAPMLQSRANLLSRWANDDEIWADLFDD